jgi:hypothetical protein
MWTIFVRIAGKQPFGRSRKKDESDVLTALIVNVALFWDIAPCILYVNRRFGGIYHHLLRSHLPNSGLSDFQP